MAQRKNKEKRVIPTREIGKPIDQKQLRPSQILFQQVKAEFENENLDTQNKNLGHSNIENLDTQTSESWTLKTDNSEHPKQNNLDTQSKSFGHSNIENLDTFAPKNTIQAPKKDEVLDTFAPKNKNLDTQKKYDYRKYEAKRSTVRVNLHLDKELDQKVREYCVKANPRMELKEFFELAALQFLDTQKEQSLGANAPHDDLRLMIYKTKHTIINLYLQISGNSKWKINDDAKASAYNEVDLKLIELGMLQTLGNRTGGGKINSFAYFIPEIENWIESNPAEETLVEMLKHYRRRLGINRSNEKGSG